MQIKYAIMVAGSFVLGAAAVQTLHAASTPPAYFIGEVSVKNEDAYKSEFLPLARKSIDCRRVSPAAFSVTKASGWWTASAPVSRASIPAIAC